MRQSLKSSSALLVCVHSVPSSLPVSGSGSPDYWWCLIQRAPRCHPSFLLTLLHFQQSVLMQYLSVWDKIKTSDLQNFHTNEQVHGAPSVQKSSSRVGPLVPSPFFGDRASSSLTRNFPVWCRIAAHELPGSCLCFPFHSPGFSGVCSCAKLGFWGSKLITVLMLMGQALYQLSCLPTAPRHRRKLPVKSIISFLCVSPIGP